MLPDIWEPGLTVVFVGSAVTEISDALGFHNLHPRDRFWELLEIGGMSPKRIITPEERKALAEGHADGSLSDPVRSMFVEKKTSQLLRLGIGLTYLNRRVLARGEKDKSARPSQEDIEKFILKLERMNPKIAAFVMSPDIFVELFTRLYPDASGSLGVQPMRIGKSEVWLLGSTSGLLRGEALGNQEDAFFALGERIVLLRKEAAVE